MAATFIWYQDYGAGPTSYSGIANMNWKNVDDPAQAYSSYPITAGNNSYDLWAYGRFQGSYNQILNGLWAHTAGAFGTGISLIGAPTGASQLTYAAPSTTDKAATLTVDMTTAVSIGTGTVVYFGGTGPNTAGKTASTTSNPAFTNYLATQLKTTVAASAGDTTQVTITLQYDEN